MNAVAPIRLVLPGDQHLPSPHGWQQVEIDDLPDDPWDLTKRHLLVVEVVDSETAAIAAIDVLLRGVAVWLQVELHGAPRLTFLEDLSRLGTLQRHDAGLVDLLGEAQRRLLELLADGATTAEAAETLGWSRRTLTRRLAEVRIALDADSTIACLALYRSWR